MAVSILLSGIVRELEASRDQLVADGAGRSGAEPKAAAELAGVMNDQQDAKAALAALHTHSV